MKKTIIFNLVYKFLIRGVMYFISIIPLAILLTIEYESNILLKIFLLSLSIVTIPFVIIFFTSLLLFQFPKVKPGSYQIFSKDYYLWLKRDVILEIINSSYFLNNIVMRLDLIKIMYFKLIGVQNIITTIFAPNVRILDADKFVFGEKIFIGYSSFLSAHIIKGNKLILGVTHIGNNVKIGSFCRIAPNVKIGDNSLIDYSVEIGFNCNIGKNVKIFGSTKLDDNVTIEENVIIGKDCVIGRNTIIKKKIIIGSHSKIASRKKIENSLPEMSNIN